MTPKRKVTDLRLSLKTKWFEMTKAGVKTDDYREVNNYWYARLLDRIDLRAFKKAQLSFWIAALQNKDGIDFRLIPQINETFKGCFNSFQTTTLTLGYPSSNDTDRIIQFEHAGIEIRTGNPEWGAEPNKLYFVIKHGKRIL